MQTEGVAGGWLMHNAGLSKKPVSELNSWRFEKLSACQTPVNSRAAVTSRPTVQAAPAPPASSSSLLPGGPCPGWGGCSGSLHPSLWCRELSCPRLCSLLARPVQGSFPVLAWGCRLPSGRSHSGALRAGSWLGCAMPRTSSCTTATCPAGASRALLPAMLPRAWFGIAFLRLPDTIWRLCHRGQGDPFGRTGSPKHRCNSS